MEKSAIFLLIRRLVTSNFSDFGSVTAELCKLVH